MTEQSLELLCDRRGHLYMVLKATSTPSFHSLATGMMSNKLKPWVSQSKRYRLVDANLIDPKDGQIYSNVTLDLKGGVIHRMTKLQRWPSPGDEVLSLTHGEKVTIINLDGKYVLPGLIDCHVHLATPPGEDGLKDTMNQDPQTSLLRQPYLAHQMLKRGFTTVRDCGGAGLALKEALDEGLYPGPRLVCTRWLA